MANVSYTQHQQMMTTLGTIIFIITSIVLAITFVELGVFETKSDPLNTQTSTGSTTEAFPYEERMVIIEDQSGGSTETTPPIKKVLFEYVVVTGGCGTHFEGECLLVRSGPGTEFPIVSKLRNGIVLKVGGKVEHEGIVWYKIIFDEWLRYPERVKTDWYIASDFAEILYDEGDKTIWENDYATSTSKRIVVDRSEQKLYAYEGDTVFMETSISTGLALTPTPRGTFAIYKKTPSRYMQGPLPNLPADQYYDLPGVPWNLYFTQDGAVIHGTYWHDSFGRPYSHGCVNLPPSDARTLYTWAELGTSVTVRD